MNANRADEEPLSIAYEHIQVVADNKIQKKSPQKKMYGMMAIKLALILGDFEKAGYYMSCIYKRKKHRSLKKILSTMSVYFIVTSLTILKHLKRMKK